MVALLREAGRTLAVAESCTGGLLGERITSVPGASRVFQGGVVAYANAAKESLLGVPAPLLEAHGGSIRLGDPTPGATFVIRLPAA